MLTLEQKNSFDTDGFLIIPNFVTESECNRLISEANSLVSSFEPAEVKTIFSTNNQERIIDDYFMSSGDQIRFFFEAGAFQKSGELKQAKELSINKMGHALHDLNPVFSSFSRQPRLKEICNDLNYTKPLLIQSMYIFKQPQIGGEVSLHQDGTFIYTEPMSVIGFWFALQDATLTNGCMQAIPGAHKGKLKQRFRRQEDGKVIFDQLDPSPWESQECVTLEARKGSLILLHGLLPHLSGANTSSVSRHAYTLHIIEEDVNYPKDNWLQRKPDNPARGF